ncbi:FtsK/SpoIIIE domain-containing protein [Streptomyces sp. NPDC127110]|uniref:FtsK/SpoIIIE domain-containing protein n=1 Tax=Streptomyces sp. NPDC127110 TaxID=3345362 RepID=UPI003635FA7E
MPVWMLLVGGLLLLILVKGGASRSERRLAKAIAHQQMPMQAADAPAWMPGVWAKGHKRHWLSLVPRWAKVLGLALLGALAGGVWWLWVNYQGLFTAALVAVLVAAVWLWRRGRLARRHREMVVKPFFAALRKIMGDIPDGASHRDWVSIPQHLMGGDDTSTRTLRDRLPAAVVKRIDESAWVARLSLTWAKLLRRPVAWLDWVRAVKLVAWWLERRAAAEADAAVTVKIPPEAELGDGEQARVTNLVGRRIPGEWKASWDHQNFLVTFKHPPRPPAKVLFSEVQDIIESLRDSQVLLGLGSENQKIVLDFEDETPHVGLSVGTGGGKSSTLRNIIVQQIRKGAEKFIVIDPKLISLDCLDGIPEVEIYTEIQEQWAAIAEFALEMERRYQIKKADKSATFPRWFLVMEEQNDFAEESYQTWMDVKEKKDPARPPVFSQLAKSLFKGRQANMNIISVYQRLTARAAGGTELRDQYGAKILARFSPQAWNSLVATTPRPKSSRHNGRAIVVIGGSERVCQLVFVDEDEAREYALNGRSPVAPAAYVPIAQREAEALPEPVSMVKADVSTPSDHLGSVHGQSMDKTDSNDTNGAVTESDVHGGSDGVVIPLVQPATQPEAITGNEAAAALLGMTKDAFVQARQRYKKREGQDIPGTFQNGNFPAWYEKDLKRWHAKLPRAGVKEVASK